MTFALFRVGAVCPFCGTKLHPIAIRGEDHHWHKAWGCKCVATEEEIKQWDLEIALLQSAKEKA